jgi:hypothetical protein
MHAIKMQCHCHLKRLFILLLIIIIVIGSAIRSVIQAIYSFLGFSVIYPYLIHMRQMDQADNFKFIVRVKILQVIKCK